MASSNFYANAIPATFFIVALLIIVVAPQLSSSQLDPDFYSDTCPDLSRIVRDVISDALDDDPRIAASLIRLHFHDCFVQGCDASVLLNDTATIVSEQNALPNNNSIRGLNVVNDIKDAVEDACPETVSCADILALAAQKSVSLSGGPRWAVPLGRRDSTTANVTLAGQNLPSPFFGLDQLKQSFANQSLDTIDLVALSGAHTFGRARCVTFSSRLYNFNNTGIPDPILNTDYLQNLTKICPQNGGDPNALTNLDFTTPNEFDKNYYSNLQAQKGLFHSDQVLFSTADADTISIVNKFSRHQKKFFHRFVKSMIKMGNISPLTGADGEIRLQCNFVNAESSLKKRVGSQEPLLSSV